MTNNKKNYLVTLTRDGRIRRFLRSVWLFPTLLFAVLVLLTVFKINGSSIGIYQEYFNGTKNDPALLANEPQLVRSDEWRVNTQMVLAQKNNDYQRINKNIGNEQDMSVIHDVPYKEWSIAFKPHNLSFFIMPFDNAFAFKWWVMGFLLIVSCYFFVLTILPTRKLLALFLSLALFFSPFVQWWYSIGTLGCLYYGLFLLTAFIYLLRSQSIEKSLLIGALLSYLLISFVLILYPPFQIATALAVGALALGFVLSERSNFNRKELLQKGVILGASGVLSILIILLFIATRASVIQTIQNSSYPGTRVVKSGGFDAPHLFSSHLGYQFKNSEKSLNYVPKWFNNQSESSNFLLLLPFLVAPSAYILIKDRRQSKKTDWPLLAVTVAPLIFFLWIFIPHLSLLGKLSLLDKVPHTRVLIGLGLLNLFQLVLITRRLIESKHNIFKRGHVIAYVLVIFTIELLLGIHALRSYDGFIGIYRVIAYSIPVPVIVYLLLQKRFVLAATGILAFSAFMSFWINPLYKSTAVISNTELSGAIKQFSAGNNSRWIIEDSHLENFAAVNGSPSLSGVYAYPQLNLWDTIDHGKERTKYNRYAHVDFTLDRDVLVNSATKIDLKAPDNFRIITEPCGDYLRERNVRFVVTGIPLSNDESCTTLLKTVEYPLRTFYIYRVK